MTTTASATADAAIRATIGRRQQQQDSARLARVRLPDGREALLVIVADGMGGAVGGQIASERAVEAFAGHAAASDAPVADRLRGALNAANTAIVSAVATDPRLAGMGCTLIGAVVDGDRIDWISVGDSLLLVLADGKIDRLNADHSLAAVLDRSAQRGEISAAEAAASDQRHLLRSALTGDPIPLVDAGSATLGNGARVIAATDGILTLAFERMAALASDAATVDGAAGAIVDAVEAIMPDDQDNLTVVVAAIGTVRVASARSVKHAPFEHPPRARKVAAITLLAIGLMIAFAGLGAGTALFFTPPPLPLPPAPCRPPPPLLYRCHSRRRRRPVTVHTACRMNVQLGRQLTMSRFKRQLCR
jgi:serine/threonine protein phosphatase PrpC